MILYPGLTFGKKGVDSDFCRSIDTASRNYIYIKEYTVYTENINHIFQLVKSFRIFSKSEYLSDRVLVIKIYLIIFFQNKNGF